MPKSQLTDIRQKLTQSRLETEQYLRQIDEQTANYRARPDAWSVKDHVIHLSAVEMAVVEFARRILQEDCPAFSSDQNFDQDLWNRQVVAERANDTWLQTRLTLDKTRQALYGLLDHIPEESLNRVGAHPVWGQPVTLASVLREPYRHERAHRDEIIILSTLQKNNIRNWRE